MTDDTQDLIRISHDILHAIRDRDRATLERLLHPDFVGVGTAGACTARADFIEAVVNAPFQVTSLDFEWVAAQPLGATAMVAGVQRGEVVLADGARAESRGAFTDVFERVDGGWQIRAAHSVELGDRLL